MASKFFRDVRKTIAAIKLPFARKKSLVEELPASAQTHAYYQPAVTQVREWCRIKKIHPIVSEI